MASASKERGGVVIGGLTLLMLLLWLGFVVHRSPRFAGSTVGHLIGLSGATLMLIPFMYSVIKRCKPLRKRVTERVSMSTLLTWHIYAGILGPILVLTHTGHRFESPLGIVLTGMTIVVVLSGYIGRYLLRQVSAEIREKRQLLVQAEERFEETRDLIASCASWPAHGPTRGLWSRLKSFLLSSESEMSPMDSALAARAIRLAETRADLEFAIRTHELFKSWFGRWLRFHIVLSVLLYALLGLHVWAVIYFGLRWL